jgi:predicted nucleic acid-binding protein
MLKVVIDTNVLVSALLKPDSVPELILSLILEKESCSPTSISSP